MKKAILKRTVISKNFALVEGTKVFVAQHGERTCMVRKKKDDTIEYPIATFALKFEDNNVKVKIHVKRLPRRNDSMFYYGKHIATLTKVNKTLIVEATGEMQVYFSERKDDCYANAQLAKELRNRKITDRGLSKLGENDMIQMNNWFRIFSDNDPHEDIAHTYDDAIALAKQRINED